MEKVQDQLETRQVNKPRTYGLIGVLEQYLESDCVGFERSVFFLSADAEGAH